MLRWTLNLIRARRARVTAVGAIAPLVDRSRLSVGGISDGAWSDPYIVGFIMMLITLLANRSGGTISEDAMCGIQTRAWEDITHRRFDAIGEYVHHLSRTRNLEFDLGCHEAVRFEKALAIENIPNSLSLHQQAADPLELEATSYERNALLAAWAQSFDARLSMHATGAGPHWQLSSP